MAKREYVNKDTILSGLFSYLRAIDAGDSQRAAALWAYTEQHARARMEQDATEQRRLHEWRERKDREDAEDRLRLAEQQASPQFQAVVEAANSFRRTPEQRAEFARREYEASRRRDAEARERYARERQQGGTR